MKKFKNSSISRTFNFPPQMETCHDACILNFFFYYLILYLFARVLKKHNEEHAVINVKKKTFGYLEVRSLCNLLKVGVYVY